ncbi:MAG: ferredoxin [Halanaerobiales bacterium]
MAKLELKYPENKAGAYFVDKSCIVCGQCVNMAPKNFSFLRGDKHAYVCKQPSNKMEKKKCEKAVNECPVQAIGNNGVR